MTLSGWLAGGIAWHPSAMWVLFVDGGAYLLYGFCSGHFRRDIRPYGPRGDPRHLSRADRQTPATGWAAANAVLRLLYTGLSRLSVLRS